MKKNPDECFNVVLDTWINIEFGYHEVHLEIEVDITPADNLVGPEEVDVCDVTAVSVYPMGWDVTQMSPKFVQWVAEEAWKQYKRSLDAEFSGDE